MFKSHVKLLFLSLTFIVGTTPLFTKPLPKPIDKMTEEFKSLMQEQVKNKHFSGVAYLEHKGEVLYQEAFGFRNRSDQLAMELDTKINLGSMNKMFTSVSIAQLVEQEKLKFTDTIIDHLPDYPAKDQAAKITVEHLLTHTSGMGFYWDELHNSNISMYRSPSEVLELYKDQPLSFEPGEGFGYSNSAFNTLGLIIEAISGQSYYDYVQQNIFDKAGMNNSGYFATDEIISNLAIGYTYNKGNTPDRRLIIDDPENPPKLKKNTFLHSAKGGPAGGGYSTAEDLALFANALKNGVILSKEMYQEITSPKVEMKMRQLSRGMFYGYGFGARNEKDSMPNTGHNGGGPGINSIMKTFPEHDLTFVVLTNIDAGIMPIMRNWRSIFLGEKMRTRKRGQH